MKTTLVEPHGLVSAARSWYLCAGLDGAVKFFKLARIDHAEMLPESCDSDTDVAAAWRTQRERFLGGFTSVTASAWVRDTRWSDIRDWAISVTEQQTSITPPEDEGWSFLQLGFVDRLRNESDRVVTDAGRVCRFPDHIQHAQMGGTVARRAGCKPSDAPTIGLGGGESALNTVRLMRLAMLRVRRSRCL